MDRPAVLAVAQGFVGSRRYLEALHLCDLLLRDGEDAAALRIKGTALSGIRNDELAVDALRRACALDPSDAAAFHALGLALEALGKRPDALKAYDIAVRLAPKSYGIRVARAAVLRKLGDEEYAMREYGTAVNLLPEGPQKRELEEAYRAACAAPKERTGSATDAVEYARISYQLGTYEHCLSFIAELGPSAGGVPPILFVKALCLARLGRDAEARETADDPLLAAALTPDMRRELEATLDFDERGNTEP